MKRLDHLVICRESHSYVDSLHAVLTAVDLFDGPKYVLSGMTTMAFKFTAHKYLLSSSVSAYGGLSTENWLATDILGLVSDCYAGYFKYRTFPLYQKAWLDKIRAGIDNGFGTIVWIPEYGVIRGYDDVDRVFFVTSGDGKNDKVMLYDNLGLNTVTDFAFFQLVGPQRIDLDVRDIYVDSLVGALREWETPYKLTNRDYAHGKRAYDYMIDALRNNAFDEVGASYLFHSYALSKAEAHQYLVHMSVDFPTLSCVADLYSEVAQLFSTIKSTINYEHGVSIDTVHVPTIIENLQLASQIEGNAMKLIKPFVREQMETMPVPVIREQWREHPQ